MKYSVWLFTRPITYAMTFPSIAASSDGKNYLRHWGVLVNEMTIIDIEVIISRVRKYGANDNTDLGIMYELHRNNDNKNDLRITEKFGINSVRNEWPMFSMEYIGETTMTYDIIKIIGGFYSLPR